MGAHERPTSRERDARPAISIGLAARRELGRRCRLLEGHLDHFVDGSVGVARVHRVRQALRELEGLLPVLGVAFAHAERERLGKHVRRVRKASGAVRDLDVAIALVRSLLGDNADADAIVELMEKERAAAARQLMRLAKKERGKLGAHLEAMLSSGVPVRERLAASCAGVVAMARLCEELRVTGEGAFEEPEPMHRVRLCLKDVRTLLRVGAPWFGEATGEIEARVHALTDALGSVNDLAELHRRLGELDDIRGGVPRGTLREVRAGVEALRTKAHATAAAAASTEIPALRRSLRALIFLDAD